jgi:hypothetical protein
MRLCGCQTGLDALKKRKEKNGQSPEDNLLSVLYTSSEPFRILKKSVFILPGIEPRFLCWAACNLGTMLTKLSQHVT